MIISPVLQAIFLSFLKCKISVGLLSHLPCKVFSLCNIIGYIFPPFFLSLLLLVYFLWCLIRPYSLGENAQKLSVNVNI